MNLKSDTKLSKIESPCIRNCCLDKNDICLGCFRSVTEIKQWAVVDDDMKRVIIDNANARKNYNKS